MLVVCVCALPTAPAFAHSMYAALLKLEPLEDGSTEVLLKVPRVENGPETLGIVLPATCGAATDHERRETKDAYIESWRVSCSTEQLRSGALRVRGLDRIVGELIVHVASSTTLWTVVVRRGSPETILLSDTVETSTGQRLRANSFLVLGIEHILSGPDHLLFVFALLLLIVRTRRDRVAATIVWTITAFTVAHSVTLAASVLGLIRLPRTPVEIVIPLSVLLLAVELARPNPAETLTARYPWVVAFAFGLLHGFGFADALREIGLPQNAIGQALLLFNLGVEVGQLMFVVVVAIIWQTFRLLRPRLQGRHESLFDGLERATVYAIGTAAVFWCLQRAWMA